MTSQRSQMDQIYHFNGYRIPLCTCGSAVLSVKPRACCHSIVTYRHVTTRTTDLGLTRYPCCVQKAGKSHFLMRMVLMPQTESISPPPMVKSAASTSGVTREQSLEISYVALQTSLQRIKQTVRCIYELVMTSPLACNASRSSSAAPSSSSYATAVSSSSTTPTTPSSSSFTSLNNPTSSARLSTSSASSSLSSTLTSSSSATVYYESDHEESMIVYIAIAIALIVLLLLIFVASKLYF